MKHPIELLAPGGDIKAIKAAIIAGADAVFCGLNKFNARNRAANLSFDDLKGLLRLAHQHDCQLFLTLNIMILDSEIPALIKLLNRLVNTSIDGIIVQDFGLFYLLNRHYPTLAIHASTQLTTHNRGQIRFLKTIQAERVNLSRELNISEIKELTQVAHQHKMKTEVFVHGSYCISFSGQCYMSSLNSGNSGNRGQCSQPCRERYHTTSVGADYPLNMKDNSAYLDFKELYDIGVDSLKIEGRIKESEYVYTVVDAWRKQINNYSHHGLLSSDMSPLYTVFNRDFSDGYLKGEISKAMFIDNPMNHALTHYKNKHKKAGEHKQKTQDLLDGKAMIRNTIDNHIEQMDSSLQALSIIVKGRCNEALSILIKTKEKQFEVKSKIPLASSGKEKLTENIVNKRLRAIEDTAYYIEHTELDISPEAYLPFKELNSIKKRILKTLNDGRDYIAPLSLPKLKKERKNKEQRCKLSVIISDVEDMALAKANNSRFFFRLPNSIGNQLDELIDLFNNNKNIVPYFPAILIGEDYARALKLMEAIQPRCILTDNTGIAYEAYQGQIPWIAGPQLNTANSYSLLCLKENYNCKGAFVSNELNKQQIFGIKKPEDFDLYYTIYQPILLMTSRQCLFQQTTACAKSIVDDSCISQCEKMATLRNLKGQEFLIEKSKGNYHRIYSDTHVLNTAIVEDLAYKFDAFTIDISKPETKTTLKVSAEELIQHFETYIAGDKAALTALNHIISATNNAQYDVGI